MEAACWLLGLFDAGLFFGDDSLSAAAVAVRLFVLRLMMVLIFAVVRCSTMIIV